MSDGAAGPGDNPRADLGPGPEAGTLEELPARDAVEGAAAGGLVPGEVLTGEGVVVGNDGRPTTTLTVVNTADRPVQVGSHFHFAAANAGLQFDRDAAWGLRLDVPAGTAVRFEPGIDRDVVLVPITGARLVPGLRPELAGPLDGGA